MKDRTKFKPLPTEHKLVYSQSNQKEMSSFQEKLRDIYNKQDQIAPLIEGLEKEIPPQSLDDYYVKLKTIIKQDNEKTSANYETISGKKQEIEVETLFDPLKTGETANKASINKLLILGGAGVGKSTLMQYIAYRWSKGELWNDKFDYVYRVSLKVLLKEGWNNRYILRGEDEDILKCLVHYHFISKLDPEERKSYQLKDMPWLNEKDRMLLLLDGYDEVTNLSQENSESLLKSIFRHVNIILTSRPNAIDRDMAQNFERKIENIGFDHDGINQYLTWYFRGNEAKKIKGEALEEFFRENSSIRDICKIPVNIAMMCFIWSEGDSNQALKKVSNMSDLYHQVVDRLGFRYYAKQPFNLRKNEYVLLTEWRGQKKLDELRVLQHVAYKGLTDGGIEVSNEKRVETLIIAGMSPKENRIQTSIQSSIEYLQETELKRGMPNIIDVYKYGLLRPEGIFVTHKEPSETDLQSHNFSFIHLSFQEFLTAQYFAERLMDNEDQTNFANFIAQHRNEPRYFLTLKFLAGILSTAKNERAERALKIFWEAIMCNVDGVIELGVETKVTLLMHLLSQVTKEEKIDERIPNKDRAMDLIDSVVLGDLSGWSTQLNESGFTSDNIKKGLIKYFINNNVNWTSNKSRELQKRSNPKIKENLEPSHPSLEEIMEIIGTMVHKFSEEQQVDIFFKAWNVFKGYNEETWRQTKKAIRLILTILQKAKLEIEAKKENEILDSFLLTAFDSTLAELSCQTISEILSNSPNPSPLLERVSKHLKQEIKNFERGKESWRLKTIVYILFQNDLDDPQLLTDVIQGLASLFQDSDVRVKLPALVDALGLYRDALEFLGDALEFLNRIEDTNVQLLNHLLEALKVFFRRERYISDSVSDYILQTIKISRSKNPQLIRTTILRLILSLRNLRKIREGSHIPVTSIREDSQKPVARAVMELLEINYHHYGIQFIREDLSSFLGLLKTPLGRHFKRFSEISIELIKSCVTSDTQIIRDTLNILMLFIQDNELHEENPIEQIFLGIIKLSGEDQEQLVKDIVNRLIQLFDNPSTKLGIFTFRIIEELLSHSDQNDIQIARAAFQASIQFLKKENDRFSSSFIPDDSALRVIKNIRNDELIQDALDIFIPLLDDPQTPFKESISRAVLGLIASSNNRQTQLIQDLLKSLTPFLHNSEDRLKIGASIMMINLMKMSGSFDIQLIRNIFETLTNLLSPLLKNRDRTLCILYILFDLLEIQSKSDNQFVRNFLKIFTPILKDSFFFQKVMHLMIDLMKKSANNNPQLVQNILEILTSLLKDRDWLEDTVLARLIEMIAIDGCSSTQFEKYIFDIFTQQLKTSALNQQGISQTISAAKKSARHHIQLTRIILETLTPLLKDVYWLESTALDSLIEMVEVDACSSNHLENIFEILSRQLKDPYNERYKSSTVRRMIDLMKKSVNNNTQFTQKIFKALDQVFADHRGSFRAIAPEAINLIMKVRSESDSQLVKDLISALIPLLSQDDPLLGKVVYCLISQLLKEGGKSEPDIARDVFNHLTTFLYDNDEEMTIISVSKVLIQLLKMRNRQDTELPKVILTALTSIFKSQTITSKRVSVFSVFDSLKPQAIRKSALLRISELSDIAGLENNFFHDVLNSPNLLDEETLDIVMNLAKRFNARIDDKLARTLFQVFSPLLNDEFRDSKRINSALTIIIEVMKLPGKSDNQLALEILDALISILQKVELLDPFENIFPKSLLPGKKKFYYQEIITNIIKLLKGTQLVKETITASIRLLNHQNKHLKRAGSMMLEIVIIEILLENPNCLIEYLDHSSKEIRDILISSLLECLKTYVQDFEILEQFFQDPKSSLTLDNIKNKLMTQIEFTNQLSREGVQECLLKLETKNLSKENYSKHLSDLRSLLGSELNQINTLKGPPIIELAMVIIRKEKIVEDGSDHSQLVEIAKDVLDIQVANLNDEGLKWIDDNHENLISLSTETKSFYRKVCHKLLQDQEITALEECLLIKFINQGLTISLTRSGEIIFEGKCYKLRGDNIEQALEKIAKTIIDQQQDILALQYKEHEPMFPKSHVEGGMKKAATDLKIEDVKSIADTSHFLKNDFWLLTILRSLTNSQSSIIILEKRNAFGDHFIFRFNDEKVFRFYPNEWPELNQIFGSYRYREFYKGKVIELTEEVGQKLLESKSTKDIDHIKGKELENHIYFQQELLGEGSGDRNFWTEKRLESKLDNNRVILENELKDLNLSDSQKHLVQEYYEGFVSAFSARYTSSQAIVDGKIAIDDGTDYFNLTNLFFQLSSLDPIGIGYVISEGLNAVRSHLATTPVINEANFVKDIAIDSLELSDLVCKTALKIISKPKNRQRIFDAKEEDQPNTIRNKIKDFILEKLEKLKEKLKDGAQRYAKMKDLFLEEIETTPAFQLGEDDANKIIKQWIELKRSKPSLRMHPKEKKKIFVKAVSAASVNAQQPNQQNNKKGENCALF